MLHHVTCGSQPERNSPRHTERVAAFCYIERVGSQLVTGVNISCMAALLCLREHLFWGFVGQHLLVSASAAPASYP